jgi:putative ABC transport system permease protein
MERLFQDLRYAVRALINVPGFTAIALSTIAIGTGANATVFGFVNALLLRAAPGVTEPSSLVAIYTSDFSSGLYGSTSYPDYLSIKQSAPALTHVTAYADYAAAVVRIAGTAEQLRVSSVSGEFFQMLGLNAAAGRLIVESDTAPASPEVMVIGHRLWQRMFGSDGGVIGTTLTVNGRPRTIVGVAPERFTGLDLGRAFDIWLPLTAPPDTPDARQNRGLNVVARLTEGATLRQAQAQVTSIAERLAREYPATNMGTLQFPDRARPMAVRHHARIPPQFRGDVVTVSSVIMGAVAIVLLIACANVASLLLSRAASRGREMAVRLALGASRRRLLQQLLTESLCLAVAGGSLGLLLSMWTSDALPSFFPAEQAAMLDTSIDWRVLGFVAAISLSSSIIFGLAPAFHALAPSPSLILRGGGGLLADAGHGHLVRRVMVAGQVALAIVLLGSATLLTRSLVNALHADIGVDTRNVLAASIELPSDVGSAGAALFFDEVVTRLQRLPGAESAALVQTLPLSGGPRRGFRIDGYTRRDGEDMEFPFNVVSGSYFATMRIPVIAGRVFEMADTPASPRVAVVSDVFAKRFFGGAGAVGRTITDSSNTALTIVGVVGTVKRLTVQEPPVAMVYYVYAQQPVRRSRIVLRTAADPASYVDGFRREVAAVNPAAAVFGVVTFDAHVAESLAGDRLTASLVGASAAMALLLAIVGVYGIVAYGVVRRTREIGVRVALGARRADVVRLVVGEALRTTAGGIAAGTALTIAAGSLLSSLLFGVGRFDVIAFGAVPLLFLALALLATCVPVRRALRLEPMVALRHE